MFTQQTATLSEGFQKMARLNAQAVTGKKLLEDSDDPVLAGRINMAGDFIGDINSYNQNLIVANNRTQLFATAMKDSVNILDQVKSLVVTANSDTTNDADRAAIADQIKGYLNSILNDSNIIFTAVTIPQTHLMF
jgi:flagellar hook-associated protein 3 FlgL